MMKKLSNKCPINFKICWKQKTIYLFYLHINYTKLIINNIFLSRVHNTFVILIIKSIYH